MSVADSGLADMLGMLDQDLSGLVVADVALGPFSTYRVGGAARRFVIVENDEQLDRVARAVAQSKIPVLVVGRGSNLLVADRGFDGLAVQLGERYGEINISGTIVRAGGAASLPVVARRTAAAGLTGFEWAVGVPGSIGGAVRMNAGGHGSDIAASLARVRVLDLAAHKDVVVTPDALALEYRSSIVGSRQVVVWAELELDHGDPVAAEAEVNEIVRWRRTNQPGGQNAGSVFTNPPGDSAGRLIDEAGARGLRIGSAEVSKKHANFIQADRDGYADDVWAVMVEVRRRVFDHAGVALHPETCTVGFPAMPELES